VPAPDAPPYVFRIGGRRNERRPGGKENEMSAPAIPSAQATELTQQAATGAPVLITPQQVVFSTAAAVAPARAHRWTAAIGHLFASDPYDHGRHHQSKRYSFLERASMSRAMEHL
jgi:hypothetical protein